MRIVSQMLTIDTTNQQNPQGQLYRPAHRFGIQGFADFGEEDMTWLCSESRGKRLQALALACEWAWRNPGLMSIAYSRTTGKVVSHFYQSREGQFGCLLYDLQGTLRLQQCPSLFVMQPEVRTNLVYPVLSEGAAGFLKEWMHSHQPDRENWLEGLLHEPILRRILATLTAPPGLPSPEIDRVAGRKKEVQAYAQHLKSGQLRRGDPLIALSTIIEEIAVLAFIEDGISLFGMYYQSRELGEAFYATLSDHPSGR